MCLQVVFCLFIFLSSICAQYFSPAPSDPDLNACDHVGALCGPGTNFPEDTSYCCDNVHTVYCQLSWWENEFHIYQGACNSLLGLQCVDSETEGATCLAAAQ